MTVTAATHRQALRISSMLTDSYRHMYRPESAMVRPEKVIRILKQARVHFVVMGTHAISGYRSEPRATQDVDVLVRKRDHTKAVTAVQRAYRKLLIKDTPAVTRFIDPATKLVVIDLMKPFDRLYQSTFKFSVAVGDDYLIPNLEMALASKFAAMTSHNRDPDKKMVDAGDFLNIVRHNAAQINMRRLRKFADLVYPGGGVEITEYVEEAKAGRTLRV